MIGRLDDRTGGRMIFGWLAGFLAFDGLADYFYCVGTLIL